MEAQTPAFPLLLRIVFCGFLVASLSYIFVAVGQMFISIGYFSYVKTLFMAFFDFCHVRQFCKHKIETGQIYLYLYDISAEESVLIKLKNMFKIH